MSEDLFSKSFLTVQCILGNKANVITMVDTCTNGYDFIDKKFAKIICQTLEIEL